MSLQVYVNVNYQQRTETVREIMFQLIQNRATISIDINLRQNK